MPIDADAYMSGVIPTLSRGGSWLPDEHDTSSPPLNSAFNGSKYVYSPDQYTSTAISHGLPEPARQSVPRSMIPPSMVHPLFFPRSVWSPLGMGRTSQAHSVSGMSGSTQSHPLNLVSPFGPVKHPGWAKGGTNLSVIPSSAASSSVKSSTHDVKDNSKHVPSSAKTEAKTITPISSPRRRHSTLSHLDSDSIRLRRSDTIHRGSWEEQAGAPKPLPPEPDYLKCNGSSTVQGTGVKPHRPVAESLPPPPQPRSTAATVIDGTAQRARYASNPASTSSTIVHGTATSQAQRPKAFRRHTSEYRHPSVKLSTPQPSMSGVRSVHSPLSPYRAVNSRENNSEVSQNAVQNKVDKATPRQTSRTSITKPSKTSQDSPPKTHRPFPSRRHTHGNSPAPLTPPSFDTSGRFSNRIRHASSPSLSNMASLPVIESESSTIGSSSASDPGSHPSQKQGPQNTSIQKGGLNGLREIADALPKSKLKSNEVEQGDDQENRRQKLSSRPKLPRQKTAPPQAAPYASSSIPSSPMIATSSEVSAPPSMFAPRTPHGYIPPLSTDGYDRYLTHPAAPAPSQVHRASQNLNKSHHSPSTRTDNSQQQGGVKPNAFAATATTQTPNRYDTISKEGWYLPIGYARPTAPAPAANLVRDGPAMRTHGVPWVVGEEGGGSRLSDRPEGPRWVQARPPREGVVRGGGWWESGGEGRG